MKRLWTRFSIAVAFFPLIVMAITGAYSCLEALGQTGLMAAVGRWTGMSTALYATSYSAYVTHTLFTTGRLPLA
jgi:hypothetical protein